MEYAQQLTNEDFGEPRFARQMEDAQLLRDVEMGDPGNTHDVSWGIQNIKNPDFIGSGARRIKVLWYLMF